MEGSQNFEFVPSIVRNPRESPVSKPDRLTRTHIEISPNPRLRHKSPIATRCAVGAARRASRRDSTFNVERIERCSIDRVKQRHLMVDDHTPHCSSERRMFCGRGTVLTCSRNAIMAAASRPVR